MPVVVVESPAKAKTINKYLGSAYSVFASYGHVRDLPPKDGSVDPNNNFEMLWELSTDSYWSPKISRSKRVPCSGFRRCRSAVDNIIRQKRE